MNSLQLLHNIANCQETKGPDKGLFLSNRYHKYFPLSRTDNNIFFTSSIIIILDLLADRLSTEEKSTLESIRQNALSAFGSFCKKGNPDEYNFWKTGTNKHFPESIILKRLKFFQLPFDLDSSSVTYKAQKRSTKEIKSLQLKMLSHANTIKGNNKTSLKKYQILPLYSSWFGEKMPIEIDLCVLCNILTLIFSSGLDLNDSDLATIEMIESVVKNGEYFDHAFILSPAYPNSTVILYHISRVLLLSESSFHKNCKTKLLSDLLLTKEKTSDPFENILLDISIAKLTSRNVTYDESLYKAALNSAHPWFTAGFLSAFSSPVIKALAPSPLFHMKFNCIAFNNTVVFEYLKYSD